MEAKNKLKILFIYRGVCMENRGTPIKVRSLFAEFDKMKDIEPYLFSWDKEGTMSFKNHLNLTNKHLDDLKKIYRFVKEKEIDVVVGHTMATYYYLAPLKFLTKAKIVLEMQGYIEEEAKFYEDINWLNFYWSKFIYGIFYSLCDFITTSSETSADIIRKYNKKVASVWGGVDIKMFNPSVSSGSFINKKEGEIVIGYAGNARIWQGLPFLVDVYKELKDKYPEFKLALLTSEKNKVDAPGIIYIDSVEHERVPLFFADCDILVIPRMQDEVSRISFPSKIVEYMAMGKSVVASRTSDAHKIIKGGVDGLLFDPGDSKGLTEALLKLRNQSLREALGRGAFQTIQKEYTWKHQAERMINLIKNI